MSKTKAHTAYSHRPLLVETSQIRDGRIMDGLRQAQYLLETTDHAVERIAGQIGFGSPTTFRERFKRLVGASPQAYRRSFHVRRPS